MEISRIQSRAEINAPVREEQLAWLLGLADQCVKCGYCLPYCPTFQRARQEGESPRGRIALIQGWLGGDIPYNSRLDSHLNSCLVCRACEPACPSLVRFGELMDGAKARRVHRRSRPRRWLKRLQFDLLTQPTGLRFLAAIGIAYRWLHVPPRLVRSIARQWPTFDIVDGSARRLRWPTSSPQRMPQGPNGRGTEQTLSDRCSADGDSLADSPARSGAVLFHGCISRSTQQATAEAAIRVLTRLGCPVDIVDGQVCCGAVHRHNGFPEDADRLLQTNLQRFNGRTAIGFASACVAELTEHAGIQAVEICQYLVSWNWPEQARLAPLPVPIAVHEPCSHRNLLRNQQSVYTLLQLIPNVVLTSLAGNSLCCGAAGTYLTQHPETAIALAAPKIDALRALRPRYLVTTNTGCALHLEARAQAAGLNLEVVHPVELIDRQLTIDA